MNTQFPTLTMYDCFERSPGIEKIVSSLNLRRIEWDILFALDGHKSGHEIGDALKVSEGVILPALAKLRHEKLIEMKTYSIEEYKKLFLNGPAASPPSAPRRSEENPPAAKSEPAAVPPEPPMASRSPLASPLPPIKPISFSLRRSGPLPAVGPNRKLMPIVNFVSKRAGGGLLGQIASYRVLLKIPQELLQDLQIETLNLTDPEYEVPTEEAYQAILEGVKSVLNVPYEPG